MLLVIPVDPDKCFRYTSEPVALNPGCEYSSLSAHLPPDVCSRYEYSPLFHSLPAHGQLVTAHLLSLGLGVALGLLCLFLVKVIIIIDEHKLCILLYILCMYGGGAIKGPVLPFTSSSPPKGGARD